MVEEGRPSAVVKRRRPWGPYCRRPLGVPIQRLSGAFWVKQQMSLLVKVVGSVSWLKIFEVDAVEAGGSAFGCYPDIAVERLEYLMDAALGEAVFGRPRLMAEVGGL